MGEEFVAAGCEVVVAFIASIVMLAVFLSGWKRKLSTWREGKESTIYITTSASQVQCNSDATCDYGSTFTRSCT